MTFICAGFKRVRQRLGTIYGNGTLDAQATGINAAGPNGDGSGDSTITPPASPSTNQTITINNTGSGTVTVSGTITGGYSSAEMSADASVTISWNGASWDVDSESGTIVYIAAPVYATWNPADKGADVTLSGGDLIASMLINSDGSVRSDVGVSAGKWYWEYTINAYTPASNTITFGIATPLFDIEKSIGWDAGGDSWGYGTYSGVSTEARKFNLAAYALYGTIMASGGIVGVAMDVDTGTIEFFYNGVSQGVAFTNLLSVAGPYHAAAGLSGEFLTEIEANFGASAFTYSVPSGYNSGLYE